MIVTTGAVLAATSSDLGIGLAAVVVLGVGAQCGRQPRPPPAILLLLAGGVLAGPVFEIVKPDELLGDLLFPACPWRWGSCCSRAGWACGSASCERHGPAPSSACHHRGRWSPGSSGRGRVRARRPEPQRGHPARRHPRGVRPHGGPAARPLRPGPRAGQRDPALGGHLHRSRRRHPRHRGARCRDRQRGHRLECSNASSRRPAAGHRRRPARRRVLVLLFSRHSCPTTSTTRSRSPWSWPRSPAPISSSPRPACSPPP